MSLLSKVKESALSLKGQTPTQRAGALKHQAYIITRL